MVDDWGFGCWLHTPKKYNTDALAFSLSTVSLTSSCQCVVPRCFEYSGSMMVSLRRIGSQQPKPRNLSVKDILAFWLRELPQL